jgi:long-chain fatty acid transport protein
MMGIVIAVTVSIPHPASSAGFLNDIQSAGAASVSTAGQTAIAEDASTVYYNPAGMALFNRPEILLSPPVVSLSNRFENGGTTGALGEPARGSGGNKDEVFSLPTLFATAPLSDRFSVGLGLFIPFGQVNEYSDNWVGRYQLQSISLKTFDIDPAIAYRVSDTLSVGAGIDIQYAHLVRKNAIDFGALCFIAIGPAICPGLALLPESADGEFTADVKDWNIGFNFSALYNVGNSTHIGFNYRSAIRHNFSGDAKFEVPVAAGPLRSGGLFQDTRVQAMVTFPEVIALGLSQKIDDRLTLLVDVDWTGWSRLKQITLNFGNPVQPVQSLLLNWHDSTRFALGGIYHFDDNTDLRAGFSYDQSAVSDAFRSADLPDSDAMMYSAGLMHRFDDRFSMTVSYSYGHHAAAPVNLLMPGAGTLVGTFHRSSNAVGLDARILL